MDALLDSAQASRAPHLAPCAWLGAYRSTLRSSFGAICSPSIALAAFAANGALRTPAYRSGPRGGVRSGARTDEVEFRQENRPMRGFVPAGV